MKTLLDRYDIHSAVTGATSCCDIYRSFPVFPVFPWLSSLDWSQRESEYICDIARQYCFVDAARPITHALFQLHQWNIRANFRFFGAVISHFTADQSWNWELAD
jgi:hypothetical protein